MPTGLPESVESWESRVSEALKSRSDLRTQFEATPAVPLSVAVIHSATDEMYHRLEGRLGVLEAIEQSIMGQRRARKAPGISG